MKKTRDELLNKASELHYDLCRLEDADEECTDEMMDKYFELCDIMRDFINGNHHKTYYTIPGTKDYYGGSNDKVEIDPDIAEVVKILNAKGYVTVASCSGHEREIKKDKRTDGYIWIRNFPKMRMPRGLRRDPNREQDGASVRWYAESTSGLYIRLGILKKWANNLPIARTVPVGPHPTRAQQNLEEETAFNQEEHGTR